NRILARAQHRPLASGCAQGVDRIGKQAGRMPLSTSRRLRGYVKEMPDSYGDAGAVAHIAEPVADCREDLIVILDRDVRLVEPLRGIVEITKGLPRLVLVCIKRAHPESDRSVFFVRMEQAIGYHHSAPVFPGAVQAGAALSPQF